MSFKGAAIAIATLAIFVAAGAGLFRALEAHRASSPQASAKIAGAPDPAAASSAAHALKFEPFSPVEVDSFLAKARQAEKLKDGLQRCLAYPDPPRSHWNAGAVAAYCRYRSLPTIPFDQVRKLVESGHAAELDRRLADALQAQLSRPASQGWIDRIYLATFYDDSFGIRPTLDAWKRASPNSAFAYAASGAAYVAMAGKARGAEYISKTPLESILSMDRLAKEADADLRHAVQLDPRISTVYGLMMEIGRMSLGRRYALDALAAGMRAAPANYFIYGEATTLAEPKWGGSMAELHAILEQALRHTSQNPLLYVTATDARLDEFDFYSCRCNTPPQLARMMAALAEPGSYPMLSSAGDSSEQGQEKGLAAVYYSEAIRFADKPDDRLSRAYHLVTLGYPSWARDELMAIAPALPGRASVYRAMGYADRQLDDRSRAMSDLEQAVRLDYTDAWSWSSLGWLYADSGQWDKAWDAAGQLIRLQPDDPDGWRMRAYVQTEQPRAGLGETVDAFASRFGNRVDQQDELRQMRKDLARIKTGPGSKGGE